MSIDGSLSDRQIYVVDTNVIIDYVDIIPDGKHKPPEEPTVDLTNAHLVIPTAVVRELSSFKRENTDRGKAARTALRRLRKLTESDMRTMNRAYNLDAPTKVKSGKQLISVLPVHKDFKSLLPFSPSEDDMDGQIILATLTVIALCDGLKICKSGFVDGYQNCISFNKSNGVTLLTNDNGLAIRARERGIMTSRYGYKYPEPYKGRRDLIVPPEIFSEFFNEKVLDRDIWETFMPSEERLVANEFIAMHLESANEYPKGYFPGGKHRFSHIGRYDIERDQIVDLQYIKGAPFNILNDGQAMYAEALMNPGFAGIICTGPAGSGKTYLPTAYGIDACKRGEFLDIALVPCADYSSIGALPGDLNKKMALDVGPTRNAIRNYLLNTDPHFKKAWTEAQMSGMLLSYEEFKNGEPRTSLTNELNEYINFIWQAIFRNIPVSKARGLDFAYELIHYDEFQDQSPSQADMLIKRLGTCGKMIISGDIKQIHAPYLDENNNGIVYASRELYNNPLVARVSLLEKEVERHELVKMIAERQAARKRR